MKKEGVEVEEACEAEDGDEEGEAGYSPEESLKELRKAARAGEAVGREGSALDARHQERSEEDDEEGRAFGAEEAGWGRLDGSRRRVG